MPSPPRSVPLAVASLPGRPGSQSASLSTSLPCAVCHVLWSFHFCFLTSSGFSLGRHVAGSWESWTGPDMGWLDQDTLAAGL